MDQSSKNRVQVMVWFIIQVFLYEDAFCDKSLKHDFGPI